MIRGFVRFDTKGSSGVGIGQELSTGAAKGGTEGGTEREGGPQDNGTVLDGNRLPHVSTESRASPRCCGARQQTCCTGVAFLCTRSIPFPTTG